jgi:hypothetical protein
MPLREETGLPFKTEVHGMIALLRKRKGSAGAIPRSRSLPADLFRRRSDLQIAISSSAGAMPAQPAQIAI